MNFIPITALKKKEKIRKKNNAIPQIIYTWNGIPRQDEILRLRFIVNTVQFFESKNSFVFHAKKKTSNYDM